MMPLTPEQRLSIVALRDAGHNIAYIARHVGVHRNTVVLWIRRFQEEGNVNRHPPVPRARVTTAEQDAAIVAMHSNAPFTPTRETATLHNVCLETVRRRLRAARLNRRRCARKPVNGALTDDKVTIKNEPPDVYNGDVSRDTNITEKHEEHDLQLSCAREVDVRTNVKSEPADADDVYTSDEAGSVEPADVAGSLGAATITKQEMDIGPTVLQPPDIHYMLRPCKPEPAEDALPRACNETEAQPVSAEKKLHTDTMTGDGLYKCNICFKRFGVMALMTKHIKFLHTHVRSYKCNICYKSFEKKPVLVVHMVTHTDIWPYECDVCCRSFKRKSCLIKHVLTHMNKRRHKCDVCYKSFLRKSDHLRHVLLHTGEKPNKCDVCGKGFLRKDSMEKHKFSHTNERPFKCDDCNKSFKIRKSIKAHMLTHRGKPYKCDICHKIFKSKLRFEKHAQTHRSDWSRMCYICFERFRSVRDRRSHIMLSHSGERPFKCDFCNMSFETKNTIRTHVSTHGFKPYK